MIVSIEHDQAAIAPLSDVHIVAAWRGLGHLAILAARTEEAERRVLASAEDRQAAVDADLAKLRTRILIDPEAE